MRYLANLLSDTKSQCKFYNINMSTSDSRSDNYYMGAEAIVSLEIGDDLEKPKKGCKAGIQERNETWTCDMVSEIDLKKGIQDRDKEILKLKQEVERLLEEKKEAIVTLKSKNKEIEELKTQVKKLEAEKTFVEENNLILEGQVKDLKGQITILKDQITILKKQINKLEAEKVDLKKQQKDLENKYSTLNEEVGELEGNNLALGEMVDHLKNENRDLKKDVRHLKEEHKDLQEDVDGLKCELDMANRPLLVLGELCYQIPSLMYQKVIPQWYNERFFYFVEDIDCGITALGEEDSKESQSMAEKSWAKLKKELNWKAKYAIPLRTVRKSRKKHAHPNIDEELLRKAAKEAKENGDLDNYTYNMMVELIGIWKKLNLGN